MNTVKKFSLIAAILFLVVVIIGVTHAVNTGERSPILVSGTLELDDQYVENAQGIQTLFLVLYDVNSPMPMPYGAVKEKLPKSATAGKFFEFFITKEKITLMRPDTPVPSQVRIKARLDKDGIAGRDQPGDLTGEIKSINTGSQDLKLVIDTLITDQ